jgi:hypothetical protein
MRSRREAMQRPGGPDLRRGRVLAERRCVRFLGVREWRVHGRVRSRRDPVFVQRRPNVQCERSIRRGRRVRFLGVCERRVHGRVRANDDPVRDQRRADVHRERSVGHRDGLSEPVPHRGVSLLQEQQRLRLCVPVRPVLLRPGQSRCAALGSDVCRDDR